MLASSWPMNDPMQTVATMIQVIAVACFEVACGGLGVMDVERLDGLMLRQRRPDK
jgi:hypothetical protein